VQLGCIGPRGRVGPRGRNEGNEGNLRHPQGPRGTNRSPDDEEDPQAIRGNENDPRRAEVKRKLGVGQGGRQRCEETARQLDDHDVSLLSEVIDGITDDGWIDRSSLVARSEVG
jgi:hypothetical protein